MLDIVEGKCVTLIRIGIRIMAFGVLYDFTGNSNVSKVIKAADLVKESWFLSAIKYERPIDIFVIIGHNPVRATDNTSTLGLIYQTIRELRPNVPIQAFGGHTHIRYGFWSLLFFSSIDNFDIGTSQYTMRYLPG